MSTLVTPTIPEIVPVLEELERRTGARHTIAFGTDGLLRGHTGDHEQALVRAEQLAPSCWGISSLAARVPALRPGTPHTSDSVDHFSVRYRTPQGHPWWLLVTMIPGEGGLATELLAPEPHAIAHVSAELTSCAERLRGALVTAQERR